MAELLFTTDAFRPEGRPMPGVPMLLDSSMRLIEPACAWLMHIALVRGRTRSPQTWRSYGEALYDWWQTLEANGWTWDRLGYHEAAASTATSCLPAPAAATAAPMRGPQSTSACASSPCSTTGASPAAWSIGGCEFQAPQKCLRLINV